MSLNPARNYYTVVISSYVLFQRDNQVLLARRINTGYRDGEYGVPAGHIEKDEFATEAAIREIKEEVGVRIKPGDLRIAHIMHRHCGDHERIDFFFTATQWEGEITNTEPEKCDDLRWFAWDSLPTNTIHYVRAAIERWHQGQFFSEFTE